MQRRAFVAATALGVGGCLSVAAAAPDASPAPAASPAAPPVGRAVPFHFDRDAFAATLNKPYPHRQLITATSYAEGAAVPHYLGNTLRAYADPAGFAAGPDAMHCVAVLYGTSIAMVLDDAAWAAYPIGLAMAETPQKADAPVPANIARKNPLLADVHDLVATHGVSFFVCNNAFSGISAYLAHALDGKAPTRERVVAVHDDLVSHFVPGASLVPAGVAAINAIQEARFTFLHSIA
jgi:intracellular sulfur oxidation DsrE/DsrF family protein